MPLGGLGRGEVDTFLQAQRFVDGLPLQTVGNEKANEIRYHQRNDDGIVVCDLEDHDDRSHGNPQDARKGRSHSYQCVGARSRGMLGEHCMNQTSNRSPNHGSNEQAGAKDAAGIAGCIAGRGREKLEQHQQRHHL